MARLKVLSVYDSKVNTFEKPFFMRNRAEGIRSWMTAVNDDKTQFYAHPSDYSLMEIGEYDEETGTFSNAEPAPVNLGLATQFKRPAGEARS